MSRRLRSARFRNVIVAVATAVVTLGVSGVAVAGGPGTAQRTVPSAVPSTSTPNITDGVVYAINQVGSLVLVGGDFTGVQNPGSSTTLSRTDLLAFDATTGTVSTTFAPTVDGIVEAIAPGPTPTTVYIGGFFNTVDGVKSKGVALLDTQTGDVVTSFHPPALNGAVFDLASTGSHLIMGGSFTLADAATRDGLASLDPSTGALDSYLTVALTGHHNYDGTSKTVSGAVGPRALSINPAQTRMMVFGNFTSADGLARDQIVMIDLDAASASVDPNWATLKYTSPCRRLQHDTYMTDVEYAPDGSYFVVTATGGHGVNSDGSEALCDGAARWDATDTGTDVAPHWIDLTGGDTLLSVAVTGTAVYVGGHQRWLNNELGRNVPKAGSVPRPGLAALDPLSGLPLSWNPGRNPRGAGAYALFASTDGLYVGSDTDYFGDFAYKRQKIGFFPLAGGRTPSATSTAKLPGDVYLTGPTASPSALVHRSFDGSVVGPVVTAAGAGIDWSTVRGAFLVGQKVFYGQTDGTFHRALIGNGTLSPPTTVDPYDDPAWSSVPTGSGQTYQGFPPTYYGELSQVSGSFYSNGRLYYTRAGKSSLYWRWFAPDSGVIGAEEFKAASSGFASADGMFLSRSTLYVASSQDGDLRSLSFVGGVVDPATSTIVSGPTIDGVDWRSNGLFLYDR